mgnify:CR=1 FL=1
MSWQSGITSVLLAHRDPELYDSLVLVDALRMPRVCERAFAEKELAKRLK